eukprot:scpid69969/ scgid34995/ Dynamin-binding protein; Scaffold protein Tuba
MKMDRILKVRRRRGSPSTFTSYISSSLSEEDADVTTPISASVPTSSLPSAAERRQKYFSRSETMCQPYATIQLKKTTGTGTQQGVQDELPWNRKPSISAPPLLDGDVVACSPHLYNSIPLDGVMYSFEFQTEPEHLDDTPDIGPLHFRGLPHPRYQILQELLTAERKYVEELRRCITDYLIPLRSQSVFDTDILFGNMENLYTIANKLLAKLQECVTGSKIENAPIGQCFVGMIGDLAMTYQPYCCNHGDASQLLSTLYFSMEFQRSLSSIATQGMSDGRAVSVMDLRRLLVSPVEHVAAYPLLLLELKNYTDELKDGCLLTKAVEFWEDLSRTVIKSRRCRDSGDTAQSEITRAHSPSGLVSSGMYL